MRSSEEKLADYLAFVADLGMALSSPAEKRAVVAARLRTRSARMDLAVSNGDQDTILDWATVTLTLIEVELRRLARYDGR